MQVFCNLQAIIEIKLLTICKYLKNKEKQFSELLKECRTDLGLTQEAMALRIGMSSRMYSYYENGDYDDADSVRKAKYLRKLAEIKSGGQTLNEPPVEYGKRSGNIIHVPLTAYGGFLHGYANKVYTDTLERFSLPGITGEHYAFEVDGM